MAANKTNKLGLALANAILGFVAPVAVVVPLLLLIIVPEVEAEAIKPPVAAAALVV